MSDDPRTGRDSVIEFVCLLCSQSCVARREDCLKPSHPGQEKYLYGRCSSCHSLQLLNPPTDFSGVYSPEFYYSHAPRTMLDTLGNALRSSPSFRGQGRLYELLQTNSLADPALTAIGKLRPAKTSRILDVGCGDGRLLRRLEYLGFRNLVGTDPYARPVARNGLEIKKSPLSQARLNHQFEIIMFHHSLEHSPSPESELSTAYDLLEPAGRILIRVPIASRAFEFFGPRWTALQAPQHTVVPSMIGLQRLLHRCRFKILDSYFDSNESEMLCCSQSGSAPVRYGSSQFESIALKLFSPTVRRAYKLALEWNKIGVGDNFVLYAARSEWGAR
jgi:SAM-dependent methyltransferase